MASQEEALPLRMAASDIRHEHAFYTGMASAILVTILTGFGASYIRRAAPFSALVYLHASVFTVWVLLFCAQTWLVAARHIRRASARLPHTAYKCPSSARSDDVDVASLA